MELKIIEEKSNPLFSRKEMKATVDSGTTPGRSEVIEMISRHFSSPPENIKIKKVSGNFGTTTFTIEASIYSSAKDKDFIELKKKKEGAVKEKAAAK